MRIFATGFVHLGCAPAKHAQPSSPGYADKPIPTPLGEHLLVVIVATLQIYIYSD